MKWYRPFAILSGPLSASGGRLLVSGAGRRAPRPSRGSADPEPGCPERRRVAASVPEHADPADWGFVMSGRLLDKRTGRASFRRGREARGKGMGFPGDVCRAGTASFHGRGMVVRVGRSDVILAMGSLDRWNTSPLAASGGFEQ